MLLALLIFWGVNFFRGKPINKTTTIGYVQPESAADSAGSESHDKILAINDNKIDNWEELKSSIFVNTLGENLKVNVLRNGSERSLYIPRTKIPEDESKGLFLIPKGVKPLIGEVLSNSPAEKAGIKTGDFFLKLDNKELTSAAQATDIIKSNAGNTFL